MVRASYIRIAFRIAANTVTDTGVVFQCGNILFNWDAAGVPGRIVNIAALLIAIALRLNLELAKDFPLKQKTFRSRLSKSPNISMLAGTVAQFIAGLSAGVRIDFHNAKSITGAAIPLCNAIGNVAAVVEDSQSPSWLKAFFRKEYFYTATLPMAGVWGVPLVFYGAASIYSICRSIGRSKKGVDPTYLLATGCGLAAVINRHNDITLNRHPFSLGIVLAIYSAGYVTFKLNQDYGGAVEAVRNIRLHWSSSSPSGKDAVP